jgi:hypothetical protein
VRSRPGSPCEALARVKYRRLITTGDPNEPPGPQKFRHNSFKKLENLRLDKEALNIYYISTLSSRKS